MPTTFAQDLAAARVERTNRIFGDHDLGAYEKAVRPFLEAVLANPAKVGFPADDTMEAYKACFAVNRVHPGVGGVDPHLGEVERVAFNVAVHSGAYPISVKEAALAVAVADQIHPAHYAKLTAPVSALLS